jgi:hypothetical protein
MNNDLTIEELRAEEQREAALAAASDRFCVRHQCTLYVSGVVLTLCQQFHARFGWTFERDADAVLHFWASGQLVVKDESGQRIWPKLRPELEMAG